MLNWSQFLFENFWPEKSLSGCVSVAFTTDCQNSRMNHSFVNSNDTRVLPSFSPVIFPQSKCNKSCGDFASFNPAISWNWNNVPQKNVLFNRYWHATKVYESGYFDQNKYHRQEGISVECLPPACRQMYGLHSKQISTGPWWGREVPKWTSLKMSGVQGWGWRVSPINKFERSYLLTVPFTVMVI